MRCVTVKIKQLIISKLHGHIDYDIKFNEDVTFLYGDNGCGKTTILNILTSIITGKKYELAQYQFEIISIEYESANEKKRKNIKVGKSNDFDTLTLYYNNNEVDIETQKVRIINRQPEDAYDIERMYFNEYSILSEVKNEFNYIYLPLNRNGNVNSEMDLSFSRRMRRAHNVAPYYSDVTLIDVSVLVKDAYNRINFKLSKINENFSEELLKSFLDVENISNSHQLLSYARTLNLQDISKIKSEYTDVLKTIKKWDLNTERKITEFFDSLLNDISKNQNSFTIEILFKLSELIKITNVIEKAGTIEQTKIKVSQPISNFLKTVNKFINAKTTKKEIFIDNDGQIYLKTPHKKRIDLQQLSSGEKQIVTFFAYLIFGLQDTKQGVFIVDEPELSLHLQWQRQFVDTILELNPDIQFIFATHAPEIIGRHRNKAFKLIPNY